ncbi:uncharacterized protein C8R40DRAFT_573565 [Lentinula edodes]|uniref:uncharacterized protein n=1 Tax=Lentinula edodes TaxID=5353 RepID=UPI001E8E4338|nr:uncharacterized protein C8R40DRAFT_573565 [Lentinula edodes]KAH7871207.1 hypothetical protein C8R40DRAFT_573565 [Lentinula edodes]
MSSVANLTDAQLRALSECITHGRIGQGISYASVVLFLYDYSLTVWNEAKYVWQPRRFTLSSITFVVARYAAMATAIIALLPNASVPAIDSTATVFRLIAIIASELRTWAIWGRSRKILIMLISFSVAAIIPAATIVAESIVSNHEFQDICSLTISNISEGFIGPYVVAMLYEFVTLTLSLIRIISWRKTIPARIRAPIIDTLWRDGVLYYSFMLILGFVNIGLVLQQGVPQVRTGGAELQAVLHSILSTRIVLHLAASTDSRDIAAPGCSVYQTGMQFTSEFATVDHSGSNASRFEHGPILEGER